MEIKIDDTSITPFYRVDKRSASVGGRPKLSIRSKPRLDNIDSLSSVSVFGFVRFRFRRMTVFRMVLFGFFIGSSSP